MEGFEFLLYQRFDGIPTIRDSELIQLYDKCEQQGIKDILFHDGSINSAEEFKNYVQRSSVIFFYITYNGQPFGFFWLNRLEATHAYCHFTCFKEWWGKHDLTVEAGKQAMQICLGHFDTIMGMLPSSNWRAIHYLKDVGLTIIGQVPHLIWSEKKQESVAGTLLYITKEDLE